MHAAIEALNWASARTDIESVNPELCNIIDEISPDAQLRLYKIRYPFGSLILQGGVFHVPNNKGQLVALHHPDAPSQLREDLSYNMGTNPVSINIKHATEIFLILDEYTIPLYGLIPPGKIISTWHILNPESQSPAFIWNMAAGARSLFMLPKISTQRGHDRLIKAFHIRAEKPRSKLNHWAVFRELACSQAVTKPWYVEVIYFAKAWFNHLYDPAWRKFHWYLLNQGWRGSEYFRNQFIWDLVYSFIHKRQHIKSDPYVKDTAQHLLAIAAGSMPGFAPALNNDGGPIDAIQQIYLDIYRLERYAPIIMQPTFLAKTAEYPVYYSLDYPSTIKFSPPNCAWSSKVSDLYATQSLLNKYLSNINDDSLNVKGSSVYQLLNDCQFDYFHTQADSYSNIRPSHIIPKEDTNFSWPQRIFPDNNAFTRGCIRLKRG